MNSYRARLYGLTRAELRYILDPKEVLGEDLPGETFRVLKEKEIKQFWGYQTRSLVGDTHLSNRWLTISSKYNYLNRLESS